MILEEVLLESMYHLPSEKKVKEILVTREMIERKAPVFEIVPTRRRSRLAEPPAARRK
jgi:ATP-dependent protease Clp ATPase subunit